MDTNLEFYYFDMFSTLAKYPSRANDPDVVDYLGVLITTKMMLVDFICGIFPSL